MAWYRDGTVRVTNGSATVTGAGTLWGDNKQGIGPGQMLLVPAAGTVQVYEILRVDSNTQLTLKDNFVGATSASSVYAIPSFYTDSVPDFARRLSAQLSYYQSQMDGWQQIMTGTGSVTLTTPNGQTVTISSFKKLTDDMDKKLDRSEVGLVDGSLMKVGSFGLGTKSGAIITNASDIPGVINGIGPDKGLVTFRNQGFIPNSPIFQYSAGLFWRGVDTFAMLSVDHNSSGGVSLISGTDAGYTSVRTLLTSSNTTVDSNGFIKRASPIFRLADDVQKMGDDFLKNGFELAGTGAANVESCGVIATKISLGVYQINGSNGFAQDSWSVEGPKDLNGNRLTFIETETDKDSVITIRTYKRKFDFETGGVIAGDPTDIPAGRWIDLRLQMPEK